MRRGVAGKSFVNDDDDHAVREAHLGPRRLDEGRQVRAALRQVRRVARAARRRQGDESHAGRRARAGDSVPRRALRRGRRRWARWRRWTRRRGAAADSDGVDLSQPVTLSRTATARRSSATGRWPPGRRRKPLIWEDKNIGGAIKADQRRPRSCSPSRTSTSSPTTGRRTRRSTSPKKVTDANPFLSEFAWASKKVLIDYKNRFGHQLQGTLTLPAGYEPGKKYPMLVEFYEIMSNTHHKFPMPGYDDSPQISMYASNGYAVFQPDIVYEIGKPGTSAVDCVTSGVKKVIELGLRRPEAHRPARPQLGRLSVVVHRHADGPVRRRRHRRAADEPHQLLRRAVQEHRHRAAGHHDGRPGAHGRRRRPVDEHARCSRNSRRSST